MWLTLRRLLGLDSALAAPRLGFLRGSGGAYRGAGEERTRHAGRDVRGSEVASSRLTLLGASAM